MIYQSQEDILVNGRDAPGAPKSSKKENDNKGSRYPRPIAVSA